MSLYTNVLIALGLIASIIVVVCIGTAIFYKVRYSKLKHDGLTSVADGGDRTESSKFFEEMYKNENENEVDYVDMR